MEVLEALITAGAQVNVCDGSRRTPLMVAVERECVESIALLEAAGADATGTVRSGERGVRYEY